MRAIRSLGELVFRTILPFFMVYCLEFKSLYILECFLGALADLDCLPCLWDLDRDLDFEVFLTFFVLLFLLACP